MSAVFILISITGFLFLQIYKFRIKDVHNTADGWILVFTTLIIGGLCQISVGALTSYVYSFDFTLLFTPTKLKSQILVFHAAASVVLSITFAFVSSLAIVQNLKRDFLSWLKVKENPIDPPGLVVSSLHQLINHRVLVSLKSGKVYVGRLIEVDVNEKAIYENRGIELFPLKSGFRDEKKKVHYNTKYIFPKSARRIVPKTIFLKLSEIESFTMFDGSIDRHFRSK